MPISKRASDPCANHKVVDFINMHRADAQALADRLGVPIENILGLSANESGYGKSGLATNANNFFGLTKGFPGSIGSYRANHRLWSKFPPDAGFNASALAFERVFGDAVRGITDETKFLEALVRKGFDTEDGGFVSGTRAVMDGVARRLDCKETLHACGARCKDFEKYGYCDRQTRSKFCYQHS